MRANLQLLLLAVRVAHRGDGGQKPSTPGPCDDDRVDETSHEEGIHGISGALHSLGHATTHDRSASCAECPPLLLLKQSLTYHKKDAIVSFLGDGNFEIAAKPEPSRWKNQLSIVLWHPSASHDARGEMTPVVASTV